jgi:transcriptional regulator with XRE-family HTH domain
MAAHKASLTPPAALSALAMEIATDPQARAAWLEVAAARIAAQIMRTARERNGLSQSDLARALGVSQARISQVESGRVENIPPLEFLMRFVDACGEELQIASVSSPKGPPEAVPATIEAVALDDEDAGEENASGRYHSES